MARRGVAIDAFLAVASKREVRDYDARPIPEADVRRIVQAGRASGSSKNSQPWRFVVLRDGARRRALARHLRSPRNLEGAALAIAIVLLSDLRFDAGRAAQNMMVAAWALGIGSCPNSVHPDRAEAARELLGVPVGATIATVITFGYPGAGQPRPRRDADPEKVLNRVDRLPLDQVAFEERMGG